MGPDYFAFGNVVIDDIVLWDGRTVMDTLGGCSPHALAGMRLWADRLGCVAVVGPDLPAQHRATLARLGVDQRGLIARAGVATPRAWQLIEADGRRAIAFRTSADEFIRNSPDFEAIPADYLRARGAHLYWSPTPAEDADLVERLRAANPRLRLAWEPSWLWEGGPPGALAASAALVDLITPDDEMARQLTGQPDEMAALATLRGWGAPLAAIRMGAAGSLVGAADGAIWRVPAVPTTIVDVTGAGNAYGGGFLVGLATGADAVEAASMAAVSASFALEQFGPPRFDDATAAEARRRLAWARGRVERVA
jgi:sugar/nucleoside kinase (ribokinase family)